MNIDPIFWTGKRVLVTGHTGFKGSWLTLWLLSLGADVWGFSLPPADGNDLFLKLSPFFRLTSDTRGRFHHMDGDIRDFSCLQDYVSRSQPHVVIHLAAQPLVRYSYVDPLGTWATNVQGSLNLLQALKVLKHHCSVVMITTDKVYENMEWDYGYREQDRLGGHDPYSASKAATEIAISSWRSSFCGIAPHQTPYLFISTARAGNVIGGGDWAEDRIVPDIIRSLVSGVAIPVRRPSATRPWQHVLEPLGGYMLLAQHLSSGGDVFSTSFNFGPYLEGNRPVSDLVKEILKYWPGEWQDLSDTAAPHESGRLHLQIDKAHHQLNWRPCWDFTTTVARTIGWYRAVHEGVSAHDCCLADLSAYQSEQTIAN